MPFGSIRSRLTIGFTLSLAVILTASGVLWHTFLCRCLTQHMDEKLLGIARNVSAFHLSMHEERGETDPCSGMEDFLHLQNWAAYVQILEADGTPICRSENLRGDQLTAQKSAIDRARSGEPSFETITTLGPNPVRLLSYPITEGGRLSHLIQLGESLGPANATLHNLDRALLISTPLLLVILSLAGWFLTGRALAPVLQMTRAVRALNTKNLYQRLPIRRQGSEISHLAEAFNETLGRLEGSFQRVRQFSGDASHELRTPLTILKGETEVALRWAKEPTEYRKILASIMEEIDRMSRIIEDLLLLAKSDAGTIPMEIKEFSLSDLVQDLYLQGNSLGEEKSIDVTLELDVTEEIRIRGDELRLRQAFLNLITNGIKYTPDGGRVTIALALDGAEVVVAIKDTGIGIEAQHLPHIFDRFYRIDKARNRQDGGTGLGLAIVQSFVEAHHGTISVASEPEQGSTFTIRLPIGGPAPNKPSEG